MNSERIVAQPTDGGKNTERRRLGRAVSLVAVGSAYFVAGKAGLFLAVGNASVSAVWPPTGIAIAALLLGGSELWPAVFAGAFLVNLTTTWELGSTLGIASGNTLEALIGAFLANRFASGKYLLRRPQSVLTFALLSGFLASTVAATVGATSLTLAHLASPTDYPGVWGRWWLGDAVGAIEVAPLILAISQRVSEPHPVGPTPGRVEALALAAITVAVALIVFVRNPTTLLGGYPLVFLVLPPSIWAAFRFGALGATGSVSTVSVIAIVATVSGDGPFATLAPSVSLLALRIFIGSLVLTALLVAADTTQHRRVERELYYARKELQRMLNERTVALDAAKSLAQVGDWSFDVASQKLVWSDEIYRILGYGEERFPVVLEHALDRLGPNGRTVFLQDLRNGMRSPDPLNYRFAERKYRIQFPNGEQRTVLSRLQVTGVENGRVTRITGTVQDITERQRIEDELRRIRGEDEAPLGKKGEFLAWMIPWLDQRRP